MMYFFIWVVFLLAVVLAVPITALLEKRKYRAEHPAEFSAEEESFDEQIDPAGDQLVEAEGEVAEVAEFGDVEVGDDFAAFDEIK